MHVYEIRILKPDLSSSLIFEVMHPSDNAALKAARKMAGGKQFEVWLGMDCIYGGHQTEPPLRWPPTRPTA